MASVDELLERARREIAQGRSEQAIPLLNEAFALDPESAELRCEMGALARRQGELALAARHLRRCLALDPDHIRAWGLLGETLMLGREPRQAAAAFGEGAKRTRPSGEAWWRLGRALRLAGNLDEAHSVLGHAVAASGPRSMARYELAMTRLAQGARDEAETLLAALCAGHHADLLTATAGAQLAVLRHGPPRDDAARRVAFHVKSPFHGPILMPGVEGCLDRHHVMLSHEVDELIAFDPDVVVASDTQLAALGRLMPRAHTVQSRHGLASKGHAEQTVVTCDYFCVTDEMQAEWFRTRGLAPRVAFWPIGYLQLDRLFRGEVTAAEVGRRPDRPVVLFAPTIGQTVSALGMLGEDPVAALRPDDDAFTLVIKPHPEIELRHPEWMARLRRAATAHPHVVLVEQAATDIQPWLVAADLLVTDVSSVMFFYLALDRPLVLLSSPLRHASRERLDPDGPEWRWRHIGEEAEDPAAIPATIARALAEPGARADARHACLVEMFGASRDGRAGERLAERIAGLVPRT